MEKIISDKYGCQIIQKGTTLFIRFDAGELAVNIVEYPISEEEATLAMSSENDAYNIILRVQERHKK